MDVPAEDVVLEMPIPEHMIYVSESASNEGVQTSFSVDGGAIYSSWPELKVSEGELIRSAEPEDVTHLKWKFTDSLPPGANGELFYEARLK